MSLSSSNNAKLLIRGISDFLKWVDYSGETFSVISQIDEEVQKLIEWSKILDKNEIRRNYITFRGQLLRAIREWNISSFSDVSSFLVKFWNSDTPRSIQEQNVISEELDQNFWNKTAIEKPQHWVVYRWGTARKLLREYLDIDPSDADENTDIDVFIGPALDVNDIRESLSCDAEWITQLDDISEQALSDKCKLVDLSMNQVLVTADRIYYTEKARKALETWICELIEEPESLFWKKQHTNSLGFTIFTNTKIYRALSMLVRGKADKITVRKDNISAENADAIGGMDRYIIIILKKIISEGSTETVADMESLSLMMYRYADLLVQMWYLTFPRFFCKKG